MTLAGIEGAIGSDAGDLLFGRDLVQRLGQHGRVAGGEPRGPDFEGFLVDPDVDLAPDPAFGAATGVPLAFALDFDAGAVDQQVQRPF